LDGRIDILFSEPMLQTGTSGTVTLDPGNITLSESWEVGSESLYLVEYYLRPNTTYTLTVLGFKDVNGNLMDVDSNVSFTTGKPALRGVVNVVGSYAYGQTLAADVHGLNTNYKYPPDYPLGELQYEWLRINPEGQDTPVGTGSTYTIQSGDIGKYISLSVSAANTSSAVNVAAKSPVAKAPNTDLVVEDKYIYIPKDATGVGTFDLSNLAFAPAYGETGGVTYTVSGVYDSSNTGILATDPAIKADGHTLEYQLDKTGTSDKYVFISIKIETANFAAVYPVITLWVTDKQAASITGISFPTKTYDGLPIAPSGGTPTAEGATLPLTFWYSGRAADGTDHNSNTPPTNAGAYQLLIQTSTEDTAVIGSLTIPFTIGKAPLTIKAADRNHTIGGAVTTYTYKVTGLASGDSGASVFSTNPKAFSYADLATPGSYPIEVSGAVLSKGAGAIGANYQIVSYVPGTLTVKLARTAPAAPTSSGKTASSVTLNTAPGYEYAYSKANSATGVSWQTSGSFTGLTPGTTYYFFARVSETANFSASPASAALSVTTDKVTPGGKDDGLSGGGDVTSDGDETSNVPVSISGATAKIIADKAYTGKPVKPAPTLSVKNVALKQGTDYTVSYKNNTKIGKATVTVTGKGKYTGKKTLSFNIVPAKTSVSKAVPVKGGLKVTWKKVGAAQKVTKYEVRYKVKGAKKWKTKSVSAKSAGLTIGKLQKGKTYQIQVRSYKTVSKVKYYSAWSKVKASGKVK
jgi:hypothetical protein